MQIYDYLINTSLVFIQSLPMNLTYRPGTHKR